VKLTITQGKVLRRVAAYPNGQGQIGGDGMIGYHSSAESLVRLGLLNRWRSSYYVITDEGRAALAAEGKL
jgi:hypothetical protein